MGWPLSARPHTPTVSAAELHTLTYLVVDDLELMRSVTTNQLRALGCERFKNARNGLEALEMLRSARFDVVLSDWAMPVMNGLDLLRAIRADDKLKRLPFLMITAEAERSRIEEVISAGVSGLLVKPYNAAALRARLERITRPRTVAQATAARPSAAAPLSSAASRESDGFMPSANLPPMRILVVDDYPVTRKVFEQMLKDEYHVSTAQDGAQALAQLSSGDLPDLILMDVVMPGMDGFEVVRRLRDNPATAQLPVIFVTALTDDAARAKGMALGAVDFILKTADIKGLRTRVRNFIQFVDQRRKLQTDYDAMLDAARRREEADQLTRHDLKGSLAGIAGMVQTLAQADDMPAHHAAHLRLVEQTARAAVDLVNLNQVIYQIEMGRYQPKAQAVDLGALLGQLMDLARAGFAHKHLELVLDPALSTSVCALGETALCLSLLQNLIKNACEAAPEGSRVVVSVQDEAPLCIRITNPGVVPADMRERFFEKFATSGKPGGSGLGTYSAQLLARAQGGQVRMATSDAQLKTTLTVSLPRYQSNS